MYAATLIRQFREKGERVVLEKEAKEILEAAGIPTTRCHVVDSIAQACRTAETIGFPVVLKLSSPQLLHKSEAGGVALNLGTPQEVAAAFARLAARGREHDPAARLLLQQMAPPGVELIAGTATDPHFGTVLMLGTGGIYAELLQDAVFRLPPLGSAEVGEMITALRGYPLLNGYRGSEKADMAALQDTLLRLSELVCGNPEIRELDINPLVVYPRGVLALDARLLLQ
ncbi:MAG: acetate--CoA ligase family protein [Bacillota bacterium]